MAENQPFAMQGVCLSPPMLRQFVGDLVCGEGVTNVGAGDLLVSPSGADGSVSVAQGGAFIVGEDVTDQGMYSVFNDAPEVVGPLGANATGNPRIDLIVARIYDSIYGALSDQWVLEAVPGTANASAALTVAGLAFAPAVPTDSLLLAYVLVPNGFTVGSTVSGANILDARYSYSSCGGQPFIKVYRATAFNVTTSIADVVYDTVGVNMFGGGTVGAAGTLFNTSTGVFTAPQTGWYRVNAKVFYTTAAATDTLLVRVDVAGSTKSETNTGSGVSGAGITGSVDDVVFATAGQAIKIRTITNSGSRTGTAGEAFTSLSIHKVPA